MVSGAGGLQNIFLLSKFYSYCSDWRLKSKLKVEYFQGFLPRHVNGRTLIF